MRVPTAGEELLEVYTDYAPKYKAWMNLVEGMNLWQEDVAGVAYVG